MAEKKGNLHGPILQGLIEYVFFSKEEWDTIYKNKNGNDWFEKNKIHSENFSKFLIPFDGINCNLLIKKEAKMVCYSWNNANGPHPDRWQDNDDLTEWFNENLK